MDEIFQLFPGIELVFDELDMGFESGVVGFDPFGAGGDRVGPGWVVGVCIGGEELAGDRFGEGLDAEAVPDEASGGGTGGEQFGVGVAVREDDGDLVNGDGFD